MVKNILFIVILIVLWAAFFYEKKPPENTAPAFEDFSQEEPFFPPFACEGKKNCGEMVSCEEARFYMSNCPGINLDPDGDGVPCEQLCSGQW